MAFAIKLKEHHDRTGKSVYRVVKDTGLAPNTVKRYLESEIVYVGRVDPAVVQLCQYYNVDWHDVVRFVAEDAEPGDRRAPAAFVAA